MKGSEIIAYTLKYFGVGTVFGYPGASVLDIFDSIRNSGIDFVLSAAEQGAVFAADGYARAANSLGVVIATSGPGASNLITGIAAANLDGSALLAITGNVPSYSLGTDSFQEVDISGIAMPVTKYSRIVTSGGELTDAVISSAVTAVSGRKGAVLLDVPQDVQQAEINVTEEALENMCMKALRDIAGQTKPPEYLSIEDAARLVNSAKKPVVLLGGGVRLAGAVSEANHYLKQLRFPVVTTLMGVSLYDSREDNYFGLTGAWGNPTANHALNASDAIISLGVRFNDRLRFGGALENKTIIQLDIDEAENNKTIETSHYIKGDIKSTLPELFKRLNPRGEKAVESLITYRRKVGRGDNNRAIRNAYGAIAEALSPSDILATDVGMHQMALAKNYCMNCEFLTNGGLGAMGWGLGALIGAFIAKTARKSGLSCVPPIKGVLITGDGSFNMEMQELITAVSLKLPLIIIVFNNRSLEMFREAQIKRFEYEYMARPSADIDYTALARSMGAKGVSSGSIRTLKKALNEFDYSGPLLIDFRITAMGD